jgi:hypothetical protein
MRKPGRQEKEIHAFGVPGFLIANFLGYNYDR